MAIKASFPPGAGLLSVFAGDVDDAVTISRNAACLIPIDGAAVRIAGGQPTVANAAPMPVFGETGNDTLTGGDGDDRVFGDGGNGAETFAIPSCLLSPLLRYRQETLRERSSP
jgi:Ca2+-binding RTX toxin-like protein